MTQNDPMMALIILSYVSWGKFFSKIFLAALRPQLVSHH